MESTIMKYQASDGAEVSLSPAIVAKYIIAGNQPATDKDIYAFMAKCQARHLNPLAGDAYMTTYRNKDGSVTSNVIVSKDYFVRTASQQPGFDGFRAGVVVHSKRTGELLYREGSLVGKDSETLVGGWAEVYDRGRSYPSRSEVSLDEYNQHRSLWNSKPATMIRKVALVQALREAYPGAYGGLYDRDEIADQVTEPPIAVDAVQVPAPAREDRGEPGQPADLSPVRARFKEFMAATQLSQQAAMGAICAKARKPSMEQLTEADVAEVCAWMDEKVAEACDRAEHAAQEAEQAAYASDAAAVAENGAERADAYQPELFSEEVSW